MYCKKCGKKIADDSVFCEYCGEQLKTRQNKNKSLKPETIVTEERKINEIGTQNDNNLNSKKFPMRVLLSSRIIMVAILIGILVLVFALAMTRDYGNKTEKDSEIRAEDDFENIEENDIVENDFVIQAEDDFKNIEENDIAENDFKIQAEDDIVEPFISDSEEMAIDGISHSNKECGGWVTEQGDWNYYSIWDRPINGKSKRYILKENIVTGEKCQLLAYDDPIYNISVMGDWIYFSISVDNSNIARIRTDGQYYEELMLDAQERIRDWFTYDGNLYAIIPEHVSASQVDDYIVKVNWESRTYEKIYNCGNEGSDSFLGTENGYAVFVKETKIQESYSNAYYEYEFKWVSLDDPNEDVSSVNYTRLQEEPAPDIWRISGGLILGFKGSYGMIAEWTENYFIWVIDFDKVVVLEIPELNSLRNKTLLDFNLNCSNDLILMGVGSIIAVVGDEYMTISEDSASEISVANSRIYYESSYDGHPMYCYLEEDLNWHEIKIEDFIPIY